jgi:hypothetical protein
MKKDKSVDFDDKPIVSVSASFRIFGTIEDLSEITRALWLKPTDTHKKGDLRSSTAEPYEHDMWSLTAPVPPEEPLEKHLIWLEEQLSPRKDYIRKLTNSCNVDIFCAYTAESDQGGFDLSNNTLSVFTDLGIKMCVSIIII